MRQKRELCIAEVRQTILSMKNSSAGWDDFPARVAKQSIDSYIEPLTCLINRSFADGIFLDSCPFDKCFISIYFVLCIVFAYVAGGGMYIHVYIL